MSFDRASASDPLRGGSNSNPQNGGSVAAETDWITAPHSIPRSLHTLSAARARGEQEIVASRNARREATESTHAEHLEALKQEEANTRKAIAEQYDSSRNATLLNYENTILAVREHDRKTRARIEAEASSKREAADSTHEQARWEATTLIEAAERGENEGYDRFQKLLAQERSRLELRHEEVETLLGRYSRFRLPTAIPDTPPPEAAATQDDPLASLRTNLDGIETELVDLEMKKLPRLMRGMGVIWLYLIPLALFVIPLWMVATPVVAGVAGAVLSLLAGTGLTVLLWKQARKQLLPRVSSLLGSVGLAHAQGRAIADWGAKRHERELKALRVRKIEEGATHDQARAQARSRAEEKRVAAIEALEKQAAAESAEARSKRDLALAEAETRRESATAELDTRIQSENRRIESEYARSTKEYQDRFTRQWHEMSSAWNGGLESMSTTVQRVSAAASERFLDWRGGDLNWVPPSDVPPALRFGELDINLSRIPHGIPSTAHPDLARDLGGDGRLPTLLTFPDRGSLLIRATGKGKGAGVPILQAAMLRYLTSFPAGKVRFTILDPVGLGRHFAAFMHLADYSELMVNSRIWTEPAQIDQRLADLSLHMENVIQQFLRNEYETLEEYNKHAGEVAEPYRVLVVSHFPASFNDQSAQRLMSLATGGARCGIYTLMLLDEDQPLPATLRVEELEAHAETLVWDSRRELFAWKNADFAPFELTPDLPPPDDRLTPLLHKIGEAARTANRVEVPFEAVTPAPEAFWSGDTRNGIDVALGRAGATKLQSLKLGRGTSQHVLIAGRTGSGKSSLLHALITNSALIYSPDEIEFYLIDFKKGVEFKTYAEHDLPHARVIAIESEREFGLSVLQRLDEELTRRGDLFRSLNVQDMAGYRNLPETPPLPRTLLIVDEFQEFFIEEDKVAQDAALLLDRLVRQGRAFGVHVHLGSQTLSGAYSLARSTLGQMAVRIALQCSEADAHLILSEDNSAARLLSRPGEAIYNDANGMVEGNHVFQVVWLPDARKEKYLKVVRELERTRGSGIVRPRIVFEGNLPSDLRKNVALERLIAQEEWPDAPAAPRAWLGEAVAIKDPTSALFRRQGGHNLLIIGQDSDGARGVFGSSLLSLAAQHAPGSIRLYLVDATPPDDAAAGVLKDLAESLPHDVKVGGPRDLAGYLAEISEEQAGRQDDMAGAVPTFLFLFDTGRLRDIRKSDDDFGYSFGGSDEKEKPSPSKQFAELVKEGPALGIHVVSWFDTLNSVQRVLDRTLLREFELRVLFSKSANDSAALIDSPIANKLGPNRAIYVTDDQSQLEKFRPYHVPPADWLADARERWSRRPNPSGVEG